MAREGIFPGDTFPVAFECRMPDPDDPLHNPDGIPATPVSAIVRVVNQDEALLELGGTGITFDAMTIIAATGVTIRDIGAIIQYTVDGSFLTEAGNYTLFATAIFSDGVQLTEDKKFRVVELR